MKKFFLGSLTCLILGTVVVTGITGNAEEATDQLETSKNYTEDMLKEQQIYTLKTHPGLDKSGASRGKNHDKQELGIILNAGSSIKIRQTNPNFSKSLNVQFLTYDSKLEKKESVDSSWKTIQTDHDTAVFIETPYDTESASIEYEVIGDSLALPIFNQGDNESEFFSEWDKIGGNLALIKSAKLQMLVPGYAKEQVRTMKDFDSIDSLLNHYDKVFEFSDQELGLDNSNDYHAAATNKYFMKEDKSTSAGAYYGGSYTAAAGGTFESFWLKEISWGQLHEIHHGYQPNYNGIGIYTGEVSNNLYNVHYLKYYHGIDVIENNWLFNYGKKEASDNQVETQLNNGIHYSNLGYGHRPALILLTMVDQKSGDDGLRNLNKKHRQSYKDGTYTRMNMQDRIIDAYGEVSSYDFSPAIQRWNVSVDEEISQKVRENNYRPVAHLDHVVPKEKQNDVMQQFNKNNLISSRFQVVDNDEIAFLNLKGSISINLGNNIYRKAKNQTISLKDGDKVIATEKITSNTVTFTDIPNGVYSVELPDSIGSVDNNYVYVKEKSNETTINEQATTVINFLGLGDKQMASLNVSLGDNNYLVFNNQNKAPHSYFPNKIYYSTSLYRENKEIYSKAVEGTNNDIFEDKIELKENDVIKIYHAETKNRLLTKDGLLINKNENTQYLQVTNKTLKPITSTQPEIPTAPNNLKETKKDHTSIQLSWESSLHATGINHYQIIRNGLLISETAELNYTDNDLASDTEYEYVVKAVSNDQQLSDESNKLKVKTTAAPTEEYREFKVGTMSKPEQYTIKEIVSYKGNLYETIVTHKNYGNTDWAPDKAPTLFRLYKK